MKRVLILLFSVLVIFNSAVFAEEAETEVVISEYVYSFPEIKPEFYGFMGYRLIGLSGSEKAGEFEYLHSSISGGALLTAVPFPHRLYLEADALNKKDFSGDVRYACKDIVLFRGLTRKVFHNLDKITLIDLGPSASYTVDPKDPGEKYGVAKSMSSLFLRFKTPNFPFHVYFGGSFINKDGTLQQRFLGGSGYFNAVNRISRKRTIDWNSKDIVLGTNSHLGPVEIDISHSEQRLDVDGDKVLSYDYTSGAGRPAGIFPHNLMPELKGSTTTLKLHTSYTGRLVSAATFSWMNRENMDSNAKADYFIGAGDLIYMPYTRLTFFIKYRHKEKDTDNPDTIPATYLGYSAYTSPITVKPSISSKVDRLSSTVRYRPIKRLTLNAEYTYERKERGNSDEWKISPVTTQDILSLSVDTMIIEKLKLKAKYTHLKVREPAYNVQPDSSDEGKVSLSWSPLKEINAFLSYSIAKEKRDNIHFEDDGVQVTAEDREGRRDRLLGSITFVACKNLTITPSYAYIRNKIKQDLLYNNDGNILDPDLDPNHEYHRDSDVRYGDIAHTYAINFNHIPMKNLKLNADISYTASKGNFYPGGTMSTVTSLSGTEANTKIRETNYGVRGDYEFKKGWGLGMSYNYVDYNDLLNNSNNGNLHAVLMTISKRW